MALPVTITGISTAVAPVGPFKCANRFPTTGFEYSLGHATNFARLGQQFTPGAGTLTTVSALVRKFGSPTDTVVCDIYAVDGGGLPTGASLGTSSPVDGASMQATFAAYVDFTFAGISLAAATQYAFVISRTGALHATDRYAVGHKAPAAYPDGIAVAHNGTVWSVQTGNDFWFKTNLVSYDPTTTYYFFGRDGTTATTLQAFAAPDPSVAWATANSKSGFTTAILNIAAYQVGNVIHMAVQDGTLSSSVATKYLSYDMATDTFLSTVETVAAAAAITGQQTSGWGCSIVVRSNGNAVILYNGLQTNTSGTARARMYYRERTGLNTYGTATRVDSNTAQDNLSPKAILGDTNIVHFVWYKITLTTVTRTLSAANALSTEVQISGSQNAVDIDGISYLDGTATRLLEASSGTVNTSSTSRSDSAASPTWAASVSHSTGNLGFPVRLFNDGLVLYLVVRDNDLSDLYVKSSTDHGQNWSAATLVFTGTVAGVVSDLSRGGNIYLRGSNAVIPYIVNDNGTLKYNERIVRTVQLDAWDNGDIAGITLSNSDKTAATTADTFGGVRSARSNTAGKYYAELALLTTSGPFLGLKELGVGVRSNVTGTGTIYLSTSNGFATLNGGNLGNALGSGMTTGDVLCVALDADAERVWFRKNNDAWSGTGDPVAGTGGYDISVLNAPLALWFGTSSTTQSATIRTEAAEFTQTTPSGFLSWMGEELGPALPAEGTGALVAVNTTGQRGSGVSESVSTQATLVAPDHTITSPGTAGWNATGALAAGVADLDAVGDVITPPAIGTGALNTGVADLDAVGTSASVGTATLLASGSNVVGTGIAQEPAATGTAALVSGVADLDAVGVSSSASTAAALAAGVADLDAVAVSRSVSTVAALASGVSDLDAVGVSSSVSTSAALAGQVADLDALGAVRWIATGALVSQAADLDALGTSQWVVTGALAAQIADLDAVVVSGSASTVAALVCGVSDLDAVGVVGDQLIEGSGTLTATVADLDAVGVSGSVSTVAALAAGVADLDAVGVSRWIATGTLAAQVADLDAVGVSSSRQTLAALTAGVADLDAVGVSRWVATATLVATVADLDAVGVSSSQQTQASLIAGVADLDATGIAQHAATATLAAQPATMVAPGVARWVMTGTLVTAPAVLTSVGQTGYAATGSLSSSPATMVGSGLSATLSTGAVLQASLAWISGFEGVVTISGTGSLSAQSSQAAGVAVSGSVSTLAALVANIADLDAVGVSSSRQTLAALAASVADLDATGISRWIATGVLAAQPADLDALGVAQRIATGALVAGVADLDGGGLSQWAMSGALASGAATMVGSGLSATLSTGAVLQASLAWISGFEGVVTVSGTGNLPAQSSQASGVAVGRSQGTGALVATPAVLTGVGNTEYVVNGVLSSLPATMAGSGLSRTLSTSAALQTGLATVSGFEGVSIISGVGILQAQSSQASGVAVGRWQGTGTLPVAAATLAGAGQSIWLGVSVLASDASAVAASGISLSVGTGEVNAGGASITAKSGEITKKFSVVAKKDGTPEFIAGKTASPEVIGQRDSAGSFTARRAAPAKWEARR